MSKAGLLDETLNNAGLDMAVGHWATPHLDTANPHASVQAALHELTAQETHAEAGREALQQVADHKKETTRLNLASYVTSSNFAMAVPHLGMAANFSAPAPAPQAPQAPEPGASSGKTSFKDFSRDEEQDEFYHDCMGGVCDASGDNYRPQTVQQIQPIMAAADDNKIPARLLEGAAEAAQYKSYADIMDELEGTSASEKKLENAMDATKQAAQTLSIEKSFSQPRPPTGMGMG